MRRFRSQKLVAFVAVALLISTSYSNESYDKDDEINQLVLIGATGDLARRYLWQAIFNLFVATNHSWKIYGGARQNEDEGTAHLHEILRRLHCNDKTIDCARLLHEFEQSCVYRRLSREEDYHALGTELNVTSSTKRERRLFYLSVPSTAFGFITSSINRFCRPRPNGQLRVVFEKPFGRDFDSARQLSQIVHEHLPEKEIFRVDHYLGKTGVRSLVDFRRLNADWLEPMLHRREVERVDVVATEVDGVGGRTNFFDKYGTIRDMLQNHLTEIVALTAMDLPVGNTTTAKAKLDVLRAVESPTKYQSIIGQYVGYMDDLKGDNPDANSSLTATFSATLVRVENSRWSGVPFLLVSGKRLSEREAHVRVLFKRNRFELDARLTSPSQIIFRIHGNGSNLPAVLISKDILSDRVRLPSGWIFENESDDDVFRVIRPEIVDDPYTVLLNAIYEGNRHFFVDNDHLMELWRVWTPLIETLETEEIEPFPYIPHSDYPLKFQIEANSLLLPPEENRVIGIEPLEVKGQLFLLNRPVVIGPKDEIVATLAKEIEECARETISRTGAFHVAFPGGASPIDLFARLAHGTTRFPWRETHVWLVDERCVSSDHDASNFKSLRYHLLRHVDVPHAQIHPIATRACDATPFEEELLRSFSSRSNVDYVVLGVGRDGHVASLFPSQDEHDGIVTVVPRDEPQYSRISMTYNLLKRSRRMAVLVLGRWKRSLVERLRRVEANRDELPVEKIAKLHSGMKWFVDESVWLNDED
ncbi:GDH/6PGL endoplasmic bifunctional protein-like [Oscarella lobularis]|uniref:GDH/6PGL endoplasmic bifunctional protein-like n=1 Tax=Oscarella lobularis TaxID=121494 RepID=UPI0033132DBB